MSHAVSFMPYFPDEQINQVVGDFRVWNWLNHKDRFAVDNQIKQYLTRYFGLYKTAKGNAERRVAVVSPAIGDPFPADQDFFKLSRFFNLLMACYLFNLPETGNWPLCLSDNFTGLLQPFTAETNEPTVGFQFGSYFQVTQTGSWEHLAFVTPQFMPDMGQCKPVEGLLQLLGNLVGDKSEAINRLFRSLEWLRLAFLNYENVPHDVRIVAMCSAFEALLNLPEFKKEDHFSGSVNSLLPALNLPTSSRQNRTNKTVTDTTVGWWCRDFYLLRSRLVHGQETKSQDWVYTTGSEHLKIALSIFEECVWGLLMKWGRISSEDRLMEFVWSSKWPDQLGLQTETLVNGSPSAPI
jgi:hypothetical protein